MSEATEKSLIIFLIRSAQWLQGEGRRSDLFLLRPEIKLHVLRLSGDYQTAVNRPGSPHLLRKPINLQKIDITKNAHAVLGGRNCNEVGRKQRESFLGVGGRKFNFRALEGNTFSYASDVPEPDFVEYARQSNAEYGDGMWGYLGIDAPGGGGRSRVGGGGGRRALMDGNPPRINQADPDWWSEDFRPIQIGGGIFLGFVWSGWFRFFRKEKM